MLTGSLTASNYEDHGMKQENLTSEFNQRLRGLIRTTE